MKKLLITLSVAMFFVLNGCSGLGTVTQAGYNKLKAELDAVDAENQELKVKIANLEAQLAASGTENGAQATEITPTENPSEEMTNDELEEKLKEQSIYVVSTDYIIQDDQYKALYPDMLNAVIKNNSGKDIKTAAVAFAAWDENKLPVKIVGQFNLGGSYIKEVDFGDVNLVDGATFGEKKGFSLSDDCDNIKTIKAIAVSYTDFDGNTWSNPYYKAWKSAYEDKKLKE